MPSSSEEDGSATAARNVRRTLSRRLFLFTADEEIGTCQLKATGTDSLDLGVAFITCLKVGPRPTQSSIVHILLIVGWRAISARS